MGEMYEIFVYILWSNETWIKFLWNEESLGFCTVSLQYFWTEGHIYDAVIHLRSKAVVIASRLIFSNSPVTQKESNKFELNYNYPK